MCKCMPGVMLGVLISVLLCLCAVPIYSYGGPIIIYIPPVTCRPPKGSYCVRIGECPFFNELFNRTLSPLSNSVIDIIKRENQCGFDGISSYVCCVNPRFPPDPTIAVPAPPITSEAAIITPRPIIQRPTEAWHTHKNVYLLPNDICGSVSIGSRITSGLKASMGEFPWMALLLYYNDKVRQFDFRCGGTVINERYVLTAAHCIVRGELVAVRLGEYDLNTEIDCDEDNYCAPIHQDIYIENFITHPEYNPYTLEHDVALIRLATPADFNYPSIKPICLPMGRMELQGRQTTVTGWGATEIGVESAVLLKVSVPVLPLSKCEGMYNRFAQITGNQICAGGYKGEDSCAGDSGGPMQYAATIRGVTRYIQYGIISYGPKYCGSTGQPSIYTKVPKYMKWILDNLKPEED